MTLLNKASDGLHNILITLVRSLLKSNKSREELIASCKVGRMDTKQLELTFNKWSKLGLFKKNETGFIELNVDPKKLRSKTKASDSIIPVIVREVVFRESNNKKFWTNQDSGASDLTRALAWLLAQDIYSTELGSNELAALSRKQFSGASFDTLTNTRDQSTLREYARFLGFTNNLKTLMIDPTLALKQDLQYSFQTGETLEANSFMKKISILCPVIDKGLYREKIESKLNQNHWNKVDEGNKISSSLSISIRRLQNFKILDLKKLDDSSSTFQPTGINGENWGSPFTHVEYIGDSLL